MKLSSRNAGFTLVELLVVMLVIAILAAIAIPGYGRYVARANRGAVKACMTEYAQWYERLYTTTLTYVPAAAPVMGCATESNLDQRYTITTASAARTYTVTATPSTVQASRDSACGTLTLNEAGTKTHSGGAPAGSCW
jgi:type IV pilus assembly protein PilE